MIERDWGQVAVVDRQSGKVIGIVTRTDLLRSLAAAGAPPEPALAEQLGHALPPGRRALLRMVVRAAEAQRSAIYVVGGFVRDLLLHLPSADFDLVVEGDAIALARVLADAYGGRVNRHRRFGTAKWRIHHTADRLASALAEEGTRDVEPLPATLDFVSARAEFYSHPTALPAVAPRSSKLDFH